MTSLESFLPAAFAVLAAMASGPAGGAPLTDLRPGDRPASLSANAYARAKSVTPLGTTGKSLVILNIGGVLNAQVLDTAGAPAGAPVAFTPSTGFMTAGGVALLSGGKIAVSYTYTASLFSDQAIYVQIINSNGSLAANRRVSGKGKNYSHIAALGDGNAVVVWQDADKYNIQAQIVAPTATAVGGLIQVTTGSASLYPEVSALGDGFAVAYGRQSKIFLQRYTIDGTASGGAQRLDVADGKVQERPILTALSSGGAAALWESNTYTIVSTLPVRVDSTLKGLFLSPAGSASRRFAIDDYAPAKVIERGPLVLPYGDHIAVGWSSYLAGPYITGISPLATEARAAEVSASGVVGPAVTVTSNSNLDQFLDAMAVLPSGTPIAVYYDAAVYGVTPLGPLATLLKPPVVNPATVLGSASSDPNLRGTNKNDVIQALGGDDKIFGLDGDDDIDAGPGNDKIDGGLGRDTMKGGPGDDIYYVDTPLDVVVENPGEGNDRVVASSSYTLPANVENLDLDGPGAVYGFGNSLANTIKGNATAANRLLGFGGADRLTGGDGGDFIDGGSGPDIMTGGGGNDSYVVDSGGDKIVEAADAGGDSVTSSVSYKLPANIENLYLSGTAGIAGTGNELNNYISGNDAANTLAGGAGDDYLHGGKGDDTLDGGPGVDLLYGDAGSNTLTGGADSDLIFIDAAAGPTLITDFSLVDGDRVYFPATVFASASDVLHAAAQSGNDVIVTMPSSVTVTLQGVSFADLTSDNFGVY